MNLKQPLDEFLHGFPYAQARTHTGTRTSRSKYSTFSTPQQTPHFSSWSVPTALLPSAHHPPEPTMWTFILMMNIAYV